MSPQLFAVYMDDLSIKLNSIKAGCYIGNTLMNHLIFADDLCCFCPSVSGLQRIIDVCQDYALTHDILFNCKKTFAVAFTSKKNKLAFQPRLVLKNTKLDFVHDTKYLGVHLNSLLRDDDDINRQVRYMYGTANRLRSCFSKCSAPVKNLLFRSYCMSMYGCQLWSSFLCSSIKRIRVAYNNSFRILHGIPRYISAREKQVCNDITTFDALIRKSVYSFINRCLCSTNSLTKSLMASDCYLQSPYVKYYTSLLYVSG